MEIIKPNQEKINPQEITVSLRAANPSFLMYPTALFEVGSRFKWKARFLIGMGYLYALCFNGNTARTTTEELKKVLSTKSKARIEELLEEIETLNRLAVKAGGEHPDKFVRWVRGKRGRGGRTEVELVLPQDLSYIYPENRFFPVPKIAFLLPVSAQAKALYLYLHYLKDKETNRAVVGMRKLAENLRFGLGRVNRFIEELTRRRVLSVKSSKQGTEFFVRSPVYWPDETLFEIAQTYSLSHPFLKEWSITLPENSPRQPEKFPNRDTPSRNSPIGIHQIPQYGYTSQKNSPIGIHPEPAGESRPKAQELPTTSNKKRITTSIYPTSNNNKGGEEVENIRNCELCENLSKGEEEEVVLDRATEREKEEPRKTAESEKTYALPKINAFQKKNNTGSSGELGQPNKSAQGVDAEGLAKIKAFLKEVRSRVLEDARWYGVEPAKVDREFWKGIREVYGEDWLTLALMYELLSIKSHPKYSRKVNSSPVGLLISFALKNSPASFRDFVSAYESVFGSFGELSEIEERRENLLFGLELEREDNPEFGHLINLLKELSPYDRLFLYLEGAVKEKNGTFTLLFTSPEGIELFKRKLGERMDFFYPKWRGLTVREWEREE